LLFHRKAAESGRENEGIGGEWARKTQRETKSKYTKRRRRVEGKEMGINESKKKKVRGKHFVGGS